MKHLNEDIIYNIVVAALLGSLCGMLIVAGIFLGSQQSRIDNEVQLMCGDREIKYSREELPQGLRTLIISCE